MNRSSDRPGPPDDALTVFWDIGTVGRMTQTVVEDSLVDADISAREFWIISLLAAQGPITPGEMAARSGIPATSISKVVHRLAEKSLVDHSDNPDDGRSRLIAISAGGRQAIAQAQERFGILHRDIYELLGPEMADVIWSLRRLEWALRQIGPFAPDEMAATRHRIPSWIRYSGPALTAAEESEVLQYIEWIVHRRGSTPRRSDD